MKCWGCNGDRIPLFTWLAGDNLCIECKQKITSPEVTANYMQNSAAANERGAVRNEKAVQQAEKFTEHGKNFLGFIFGGVALLWFIVALPSQSDFAGIVVGWAIIGAVYLAFKIFSR